MLALKQHKLNAWFGSDSLRDVDYRIQLTNISYESSHKSSREDRKGMDGVFRRNIYRSALKITLEFTLFEFLDIEARETAIEAVNAWARDGYLEISTKPDRRAWVQCIQRASVEEARNHNASFSLVFETAETPFWEDAHPSIFTLTGTAESAPVRIPGTRECGPADVRIVPTAGVLSTLSLVLGTTRMHFDGLNMTAGSALILNHDKNGYLQITSNDVEKNSCLAPDSDDELVSSPGLTTLGFDSNVPCDVEFSLYGRYI